MTYSRANSEQLVHPTRLLSFCFALALTLAGCGGSAGGGSVTPSNVQLSNAPVTFKVHVVASAPKTASTTRKPQYISTALASVVFQLTAVSPASGTYTGSLPGTPVIIAATATTNGCSGTVGNYTCTLTSTAPAPATDTWTISTYATATPTVGTTTPLSVYVAYPLAVTVAGPNTASVSTWGVPSTLAFSPAGATAPANVALSGGSALTTALQVKDAGNATLIGGNDFASPTGTAGNVAFSGCGSHLTATPATFSAANPTALGAGSLSIAYDGLASAGTINCTATAPGGLSATYTVTLSGGTASVGWTVSDAVRKP